MDPYTLVFKAGMLEFFLRENTIFRDLKQKLTPKNRLVLEGFNLTCLENSYLAEYGVMPLDCVYLNTIFF